MGTAQHNQRLKNTSKLLLTMTLVCGSLSAAFFAAINIAGGNNLSTYGLRLVLATAVFSISLIAVFSSLFAAALRPSNEGFWDARIQAAAAAAFLASIDALGMVKPIDSDIFVILTSSIQAVFAFSFTRFMLSSLQITGPWFALPPWIVTIAMGVMGLGVFVLQTWIPLQKSLNYAGLARDFIMTTAVMVVLGACAWSKMLRIPQSTAIDSIRFRLTREGRPTESALPFILAMIATVVSFVGSVSSLMGYLGNTGMVSAGTPPQIMHLGGLAIIVLSLREISRISSEQQHSAVTARLTAVSAKRFLSRHLNERQSWAATVGLRTSNYLIDHDPDGSLQDQMPATFMQIRSEELQRCINEILGKNQLHYHTVGHRVYGALDPETATRPCVDVLKLMSCLYLDAGPLIERRLKGLAQLLPIVDPGLAKILNTDDVSKLIKRNQWFFHVDYGWVDQHIVHTPATTRYGVQLGSVGSDSSESMLSQLRKRTSLGNFIWIGYEARDRILQEAPVLSGIIEVHPLLQEQSSKDMLLFTIKFEQLIPRLQRYYNLDATRKVLLDFDPSPESTKLLGIFGMQLAQAKDEDSVQNVVDSITSYPWRGFKEKDNALRLIVEAHKSVVAMQSIAKNDRAEILESVAITLHKRLLKAVEQVGYPSQILHHAQISKIALRDIKALVTAASKPHNTRFHEAWMLLATTDAKRYNRADKETLINFLLNLPANRALARIPFVQRKSIDALCALGRTSDPTSTKNISEAIMRFCQWMYTDRLDPDTFCQFLDAVKFLRSQPGIDANIPSDIDGHLSVYVGELRTSSRANDPIVLSLMSRWQELRQSRQASQDAINFPAA